jgi:hypothetical protein
MGLFKNNKLKYLIVAHDAGAAYQIFHIIKKFKIRAKYYLQGPAKRIFNNKNKISLKREISKCDIIFTGTSLKSKLELKVIKKCLILKKKIISLVDNYNNFKERFLIEKELCYPSLIITIDDLSYKKAEKYKKNFFKLIKLKDYYLEYIKKIPKKTLKTDIIYFSSNWDRVYRKPIDLKLIEFFCLKLEKLKFLKKNKKIYLKIHPSENKDKYMNSNILKRFNLKFEKEKNIAMILKNYSIAGGCETYALAISKAYGVKVFNNIKNFDFKPRLGKLYDIKSI